MPDSRWAKPLVGMNLVMVGALVGADLGGLARRVIPPFEASAPVSEPAARAPERPPMPQQVPSAPAPVLLAEQPAPARAPERRARWHAMGDTRFEPEKRDGRTVGLRLRGVGDDGLFAKLGLREGDRLDAVAGRPVTSAREMIALYTRLRTIDVLKLLIERDGKPLEITINLR
jgi:type II secretory pathway component PulC